MGFYSQYSTQKTTWYVTDFKCEIQKEQVKLESA